VCAHRISSRPPCRPPLPRLARILPWAQRRAGVSRPPRYSIFFDFFFSSTGVRGARDLPLSPALSGQLCAAPIGPHQALRPPQPRASVWTSPPAEATNMAKFVSKEDVRRRTPCPTICIQQQGHGSGHGPLGPSALHCVLPTCVTNSGLLRTPNLACYFGPFTHRRFHLPDALRRSPDEKWNRPLRLAVSPSRRATCTTCVSTHLRV
jgi:hypothetical protein